MKIAGGIIIAALLIFVVGPIACSMCAVGTAVVAVEHDKAKKVEKKAEARTASPVGEEVTYRQNCNLRAEPKAGAKKLGMAKAGVSYSVLEKKGKWRKITVDFDTGWAGCADKL